MNKFMRLSLVLMLVIALGLTIVACGGGGEGPTDRPEAVLDRKMVLRQRRAPEGRHAQALRRMHGDMPVLCVLFQDRHPRDAPRTVEDPRRGLRPQAAGDEEAS